MKRQIMRKTTQKKHQYKKIHRGFPQIIKFSTVFLRGILKNSKTCYVHVMLTIVVQNRRNQRFQITGKYIKTKYQKEQA